MTIKRQVVPFKNQDKLKEGLLKTQGGSYVHISRYGKEIKGSWEKFAETDEQDKLEQGLIKVHWTIEDYIPIDSLEEIREYDCFVATTVYGSGDASQVRTLREFKDNVLMQSTSGRAAVDFYYGGAGKITADFIREHLPSTIPTIRRGLDVLVKRYSAQRK